MNVSRGQPSSRWGRTNSRTGRRNRSSRNYTFPMDLIRFTTSRVISNSRNHNLSSTLYRSYTGTLSRNGSKVNYCGQYSSITSSSQSRTITSARGRIETRGQGTMFTMYARRVSSQRPGVPSTRTRLLFLRRRISTSRSRLGRANGGNSSYNANGLRL